MFGQHILDELSLSTCGLFPTSAPDCLHANDRNKENNNEGRKSQILSFADRLLEFTFKYSIVFGSLCFHLSFTALEKCLTNFKSRGYMISVPRTMRSKPRGHTMAEI